MKFRKNKKGFTIVELIIVIAVIGILTAVMVPTIVHLVNKANKASDESLVSNLNKALAIREAETSKKPATMHEAVESLDEFGYKLESLVARSDQALLYNLKENKFLLADQADQNKKLDYWRIQDNANEQVYNIYASKNFSETELVKVDEQNNKSLHVGFDAGYQTISAIEYISESSDKVVVRTNGGTFTVDAPNGKVHHYGDADLVDIIRVASSSYHEHEKATFVKISSGRIVVCDDAKVEVGGIFVESSGAIVAVQNDQELPLVTIDTDVENFKLQTTDSEGAKQSESDVTIGEAITTTASEGSTAVPASVSVKVEKTAEEKDEIVMAEDDAKESSVTARLSDVFADLLAGKAVEYPSEFSINGISTESFPLKNPYSGMALPMGTSTNIRYSKDTNSISFDVFYDTSSYPNSFSVTLQENYVTSANEAFVSKLDHYDNLGQYDAALEGYSGSIIGFHASYGTVVLTDNGKLICSMDNTPFEIDYILNYHLVDTKQFSTSQLFDLNIIAGYKRGGKKVDLKVTKNNVNGTPTVSRELDFNVNYVDFTTIETKQYKYFPIDAQTTINSRRYHLLLLQEVGTTRLALATYEYYSGSISMEPGTSTSFAADTPDPSTFTIVASSN